MATLQSIRNHGTILLIVVGVAMLAFILGDFLNGSSSFFNKNRENVAEIAGNNVHFTEYQSAQDQFTEVYKLEFGSSDITEEVSAYIRNQVWLQLVTKYTLGDQAEKIGMDVTTDELNNLCIGPKPHAVIMQLRNFYDETGNFNRAALVEFLASLEQEPENAEQAEVINRYKNYWAFWENTVKLQYLQEKYLGLVTNMVTANNIDAKYSFLSRQETVNVQYVQQPYYAVADSLVKVTENDLKRLYNQKKEQYKQTPNRSIEYVIFPIVPSAEDFADTERLIKSLENDFRTKEDVAAIVNGNSDVLYDGRDYSKETIPAEYKDFAFGKNVKKGDCTELDFANGTYSIARVMDCGYSKPDSVKLAAVVNGQEQELGWFTVAMLPSNFVDPAFNGQKGETFTVANGMNEQTYKIVDKSKATPKVKLAILSRKVSASSKTYGALYNQAKQFIAANNNADSLHKSAFDQGLSVMPVYALTENAEKVNELKHSRPIVRWAFEAENGDVSDVFECGDCFVVAALTEVNDGEYRSFESVRPELVILATNDKKAEYITNQLKDVTTLAAAAEMFDTEIKSEENISLASYRLGAAGVEPAVIGTALALEENTISAPVKGNNGIYILTVGGKKVADGELNAAQEISNLNMRNSYMIQNQALSLLQEEANIVDNRSRFQ